MAYRLSADRESRCIFIRYTGEKAADDVRDVIDAVAADPGMRAYPSRLHDFRSVAGGIDSERLRALAGYATTRREELGGGRRTAIVVARDVSFGEARIYQAYSEIADREIRVFRSFEEAAAWLGLPVGFRDPFDAEAEG